MTAEEHRRWAGEILKYLAAHAANYNPHGDENAYVSYGFLAERIGYPKPHTGSAFGGNIGRTLRYSGSMLADVRINGRRPPIIQCLVVGKGNRLPSDGYDDDYRLLSTGEKRKRIEAEAKKVFAFGDKWGKVLDKLGI